MHASCKAKSDWLYQVDRAVGLQKCYLRSLSRQAVPVLHAVVMHEIQIMLGGGPQ